MGDAAAAGRDAAAAGGAASPRRLAVTRMEARMAVMVAPCTAGSAVAPTTRRRTVVGRVCPTRCTRPATCRMHGCGGRYEGEKNRKREERVNPEGAHTQPFAMVAGFVVVVVGGCDGVFELVAGAARDCHFVFSLVVVVGNGYFEVVVVGVVFFFA